MKVDREKATQQLQVIRTLMERSAQYRRALAPVSLAVGGIGVVAATLGVVVLSGRPELFSAFWLGVAFGGLAMTLWIIRGQAARMGEVFWSAPMRRVSSAMMPALGAGAVLGVVAGMRESGDWVWRWLPGLWMLFYGCALNAAGFFMERGIRWLGWGFWLLGIGWIGIESVGWTGRGAAVKHHLGMGIVFGVGHLAYGVYLRATERPIDV